MVEKFHRGGRPKLPSGQARTHQVNVTYNEPEWRALGYNLEDANMTAVDFIRRASLQTKVISRFKPEEIKLLRDFSRAGANLNQLLKWLYNHGQEEYAEQVRTLLSRMDSILDSIREIIKKK